MAENTELQEARLQPPKPAHYRLPPLVQPNWRLMDLLAAGTGDSYEELGRELCQRYGNRYCLLLDRARSGMYLLCTAFGLKREWILSSLMHRPSAVLLRHHCSALALADVDAGFGISTASVQRLLSPESCCILATHTYGKVVDLAGLRRIADASKLILVENAVHMSGNMQAGARRVGSWGDATLLSFNVDKPLGGILGGALLTNREDIWRAVSAHPLGPANGRETRERIMTTYLAYRLKAWLLRLPQARRYRGALDGVAEIESFDAGNYRSYAARRIHRLQAGVALRCLMREDHIVADRRRHAERLTERLREVQGISLPESTPERPHAYTYYPMVLQQGSRYALGVRLAQAGIETKWRYYPLHLQAGFKDVRRDDMEQTERLWRQHLLLPAGATTTEDGIGYLADTLRGALA